MALLSGLLLIALALGGHRLLALGSATRPSPVRDPGWLGNSALAGRADYWQELVSQLQVQMNGANPRVVFVGDSLTDDWEYRGLPVWNRYYAPRNALNLGVGGDKTQNVLWRLRDSPLERLDPEVVVIQIGINNLIERDSPAETARGVLAVADHIADRLPEAEIILVGLFPAGQSPGPHRDDIRRTNELVLKGLAGGPVRFLDIGDRFLRSDGVISQSMMWDYLHLTEDAYLIWAEAMEPLFREQLGPIPQTDGRLAAGEIGN